VIAVSRGEAEKIAEVRADFEARGYDVVEQPGPELLPFETGGYQPDLLARRGDDVYLVEVRDAARDLPVERISDVADEVRKHRGWHFLLVTADDVPPGAPGFPEPLPSWPKLRRRAAAALDFAATTEYREAALLAVWASLEAILRKTAQQEGLAAERLPTATLLDSAATMGLVLVGVDARLSCALRVRDRVAYGYEASTTDVEQAVETVAALIVRLLSDRVRKAA
jgi:hypothetical protein